MPTDDSPTPGIRSAPGPVRDKQAAKPSQTARKLSAADQTEAQSLLNNGPDAIEVFAIGGNFKRVALI